MSSLLAKACKQIDGKNYASLLIFILNYSICLIAKVFF